MALIVKDRVKVTTTSTGTGTVTLGAAVAGFQDFSVIGDGNTTYYTIADNNTNDWEVGIGTYTSSGTTLSRNTILESSNSGSAVNFAAGSKVVFVTYPAEKAVTLDGVETLTNKTINGSSNTITNVSLSTGVTGTLPVANGGTGITSFGSGVATFLGTPSSSNLAAAVTDETGSGALVFGTSPTLSGATFNDGFTEEVFAVTGTTPALSPTNGSIQTWTLSGSSTPTAGTWAAGQSLTLMIDDGTAYTVTWSSLAVTWSGGSAPTLATSGYTVIELWKVGTTIYGALVGTVA